MDSRSWSRFGVMRYPPEAGSHVSRPPNVPPTRVLLSFFSGTWGPFRGSTEAGGLGRLLWGTPASPHSFQGVEPCEGDLPALSISKLGSHLGAQAT